MTLDFQFTFSHKVEEDQTCLNLLNRMSKTVDIKINKNKTLYVNPISQYYEMKLGNEQIEKTSWQENIHKINQEIAQKSSKMLNFNHM